ncbi:antitoxin BrnA [Candidatus Termititenax persephonae]|uniref:Antitoxin BrnA n=1 Tax=Candidatus Termititenax persephonae TaxID=2218525 RepID=A0A388TJ47_9BACT|nr:antitoxin BrnA [Candidatus Termititenax persephonae]
MAIVKYTISELKRQKPKVDWAAVRKIKKSGKALKDQAEDFAISAAKIVYRGAGRPPKEVTRDTVTLRLPAPLIFQLKATGKGWNTRASAYLEQGILAGNL